MTLVHGLLAAQAVTGILWAVLMFRTLFRLRARAVAETGSAFPGPLATLRTFRGLVTRPEDRADRRRLALATLVLVGVSAAIPAAA